MVSSPVYGIRTAMKYRFRADSHARAWEVVPVKGLGSASFTEMDTRGRGDRAAGCVGSLEGPGSYVIRTGCIISASAMVTVRRAAMVFINRLRK